MYRKLGDKRAVTGTEPRHNLHVPIFATIKDAKVSKHFIFFSSASPPPPETDVPNARTLGEIAPTSDVELFWGATGGFRGHYRTPQDPLQDVIAVEARAVTSLSNNFQSCELWLEEGGLVTSSF